jgi:hypothetical protein
MVFRGERNVVYIVLTLFLRANKHNANNNRKLNKKKNCTKVHKYMVQIRIMYTQPHVNAQHLTIYNDCSLENPLAVK